MQLLSSGWSWTKPGDWTHSLGPTFIHGPFLLPAAGTCVCFCVSALPPPLLGEPWAWLLWEVGRSWGSGGLEHSWNPLAVILVPR